MIKEFEKEIELAKNEDKRIKNDLKNKFFNSFKKLFENENILGVEWVQYTPYFNDGEECVFAVHGLKLRVKKKFLEVKKEYEDFTKISLKTGYLFWVDEEYEEDEALICDFDIEKIKKIKNFQDFVDSNKNIESLIYCDQLEKIMKNEYCEQMLKDTIGDHSKVIITKNEDNELEVEIEGYNHE